MKTEICIITWNRKEVLEKTLPNFLSRARPGITLVVANNGSTDGTTEWLMENEGRFKEQRPDIDFKVRYYKKNYGQLRVINHHYRLRSKDTEILGICCDDVLVPDKWVEGLEEVFDLFPVVGMVAMDDGRGWKETDRKDKVTVSTDNNGGPFTFCNDCYLLRANIVDELAKHKRQLFDGSLVNSGYILGNVWAMSDLYYYYSVRDLLGYQLAVRLGLVRTNIGSSLADDKYKKHCIIVRRMHCRNIEQYWEATSGDLTWVEDGVERVCLDEPEEERKSSVAPLATNIPLAAFECGASDTNYNLFTEEEKKLYGDKWTI